VSRRRQWRWSLRGAGRNLWRSRVSVVAAALSLASALCLSGAAVLLGEQISAMRDHWTDRVDLSVYLCTAESPGAHCAGAAAGDDEVRAIEATVRALPGVRDVWFENREEAWQAFTRRFAGTELAGSVDRDAIPESFRITLTAGADRDGITTLIGGQPGVDVVQDQRQVLSGFFSLAANLRTGSIVLAGVQLATTVALLAHLLHASVERRRRELRVMTLVGAPRRVIRAPFVLEGLFVCVLGATVATGLLTAGAGVVNALLAETGDAAPLMVTGRDLVRVGIGVGAASVALGWLTVRLTVAHRLRRGT